MRRVLILQAISESSFRARCDDLFSSGSIASGEENFARLVIVALALGAFYVSPGTSTLDVAESRQLSSALLSQVEHSFLDLIDMSGIEAVQICVLMGSFHLFNGKPNSGFGILGSGIKLAQTLGLHRRSRFFKSSEHAAESRTYTWWALEIFDKYVLI